MTAREELLSHFLLFTPEAFFFLNSFREFHISAYLFELRSQAPINCPLEL